MIYILYWDTEIIGYFSTAEKAEEKKQKLIQEAINEKLSEDFTNECNYWIKPEELDK